MYFNTTDKKTKVYSNAAWGDLGGGWDGIIPNYTTTQRNALSLADGRIVFNTTDKTVQIYASGVWTNLSGMKNALAATCTLDGDCDSAHCINGVCCATTCDGNCNRCNIAGSEGTCTDANSDCTGNCDICSSGNCTASVSLCTGNCDQCTGSGTIFNCSANVALCTGNCDTCSGSGTAYSCSANVTLCTGNCDVCSGSGTVYNCAASVALCSTCTCTGSGTVFNCSSPAIGLSCGGGKVAYVDGTGLHGLIAAPLSDQSTGKTWGCYGINISGADGTAIGTGHQNTHDMIAAGCTNAAQACHGVTINGYSDWYLPSKDELNQLYINRVAIDGFASNYYWSSSEGSALNAWLQFASGGQGSYTKYDAGGVRAVRAF